MSGIAIKESYDLYKFLIENNGKIVTNIPFPWSPGHMTHDVDNFLRMRYLKEIDPNTLCLLIFPQAHIPSVIASVYANLFSQETRNMFIVNNALYAMAREICIAMPDLSIHAGLSHSMFATTDRSETRLAPFQGLLHYQTTNKRAWAALVHWMERRSRSMEYQPFAKGPPLSEDLIRFLDYKGEKLALVHRRMHNANSGTISEPSQFFPTLSYLKDNGYKIVFVSREAYPQEFSHYGVVNYAESPIANFYHDLALFKAASLAIISGAGIAHLGQMFDTPMVNTNFWMLLGPFSSRHTVWLPAMVRYKPNGCRLKFVEQMELLLNRPEGWELAPDQFSGATGGNPQSFSDGSMQDYEPIPPAPDEMLAAVQEVEELVASGGKPLTPLQRQFNSLHSKHPAVGLKYSTGRLSQYFAERFADAIMPGFR